MKRRSDFEYKLNARGSQPADYARYAEYEMNLESLRRKRVNRMGVKTSGHTGQRRIFFVLRRATQKFHGDVGLWMQYIEFARKQKSNKKLSEILTSALRLHPTKPELWIYAANYAMEERSDIIEARSCMQRGLRFCKDSKNLWLQYAKLEMIYIAKISIRGQELGFTNDYLKIDNTSREGSDENFVPVPPSAASDMDPHSHVLDREVLKELAGAPVLTGAIPTAIFDSAMKHFVEDDVLSGQFFDVISEFPDVPCTIAILQHIMDHIITAAPESPVTLFCFIRQPSIGVEVSSADFPKSLSVSLERLNTSLQSTIPSKRSLEATRSRCLLIDRVIEWILQFVVENLDPDIHKVLFITLKRLWSQYSLGIQEVTSLGSCHFERLFINLTRHGFQDLVNPSTSLALQLWPNDQNIQNLRGNRL